VGTGVVADGQTTGLGALVADIVAQQPDLIYYTGFETTGIPLVRALQDRGVTASFMGGDGLYVSAVVEDLGPRVEGIMATFPGVSVADLDSAGQNFARRFQRRFGYEPSGWTVLAYDGARIALAAIEKARQADRAAVIQALREIEFAGLAGRYSFDENGDLCLPLVSGVYIQDGKWQSGGLLRVR
jgi:branched-chain amino acid transport system substrate-binding protein